MDVRKFVTPVICPGCSQTGSIGWEETSPQDGLGGLTRNMIFMSSGFHKTNAFGVSGDPQIACDVCEAIQPD